MSIHKMFIFVEAKLHSVRYPWLYALDAVISRDSFEVKRYWIEFASQYIEDVLQDCSISIANALDILQSYTKSSINPKYQTGPWTSNHWAGRRLTTRSPWVSKPQDSGLNFFNHSEIWKAPRQYHCRDACQISERYKHYNIQCHGFNTSLGLGVGLRGTQKRDPMH